MSVLITRSLSVLHIKATLERSLRHLDMDTDHDSPFRTFENETLIMALGLLGSLIADRDQVFHGILLLHNIGVGAQLTLGARHFCRKIHVWKINKMYMIYARKMPNNCPKKKYFPEFLWGMCPAQPPSPTPVLEAASWYECIFLCG